MADAERFGPRLRELREEAGLTQQQLAEKAGLSQRAVSHWEQGLREPAWSNEVALARALGVNLDAFLVEPAARPQAGRGRLRKAPAGPQVSPEATGPGERGKAPRKSRGRRKAKG